MKNSEGTIQQDSQTGKKIGTVAETAGTGAAIGGMVLEDGRAPALAAGAGGRGAAIGMLSRGGDVRLEPGTSVEMVIQRAVPLDASGLARSSN